MSLSFNIYTFNNLMFDCSDGITSRNAPFPTDSFLQTTYRCRMYVIKKSFSIIINAFDIHVYLGTFGIWLNTLSHFKTFFFSFKCQYFKVFFTTRQIFNQLEISSIFLTVLQKISQKYIYFLPFYNLQINKQNFIMFKSKLHSFQCKSTMDVWW